MSKLKEEFLERLKGVDTTEDDWFDTLLDTLPNGYAKGYLEAKSGEWNSRGGAYDEDFKYEVIDWCDWFKWDDEYESESKPTTSSPFSGFLGNALNK